MGFGLVQAAHPGDSPAKIWERICLVDTENRSGSLYADSTFGGTHIGEFLTIDLEPPFSPQRYLEAIQTAEENGVEFLVIDSLSHAWTGEGGMLDMQSNIAKRSGNSYTAWRDITPLHNKLVDKILQSDMHVAVAMRTKTEYVVEDNEKGKKAPRKIGTTPVFREGFEYEVTTFFDVSQDHMAMATKDRTGLFDGQTFVINPQTGARIHQWLLGAKPALPKPKASDTPEDLPLLTLVDNAVKAHCEGMSPEDKKRVSQEIKDLTGGTANYHGITDESLLRTIYEKYKEASA